MFRTSFFSAAAMAYDTSTQNVLVGLAAIEATQAAMTQRMVDRAEREDERHAALCERLDERHAALIETLLAQGDRRDAALREFVRASIESADERLEGRLDALEADQQALRTAGKMLMWGGGALGTVGAALAWVWDHLGPVVPAVVVALL